jgi:hypothetical protein
VNIVHPEDENPRRREKPSTTTFPEINSCRFLRHSIGGVKVALPDRWGSKNKQRTAKAISLPMVKLFMESINLSLTVEQVKALLQISQNQLFRMKFLDPKMPGYKARPGEVEAAESAVQALTDALKETRLRATGTWANPTHHGRLPRVK